MGKPITISSSEVFGDVAVIDTDRSITGQDGAGFASPDAAAADATIPGRLAGRLFAGIPGLSHVFVASSQAILRRDGGWDDASRAAAGNIIAGFFVFYP